MTIKRRIKIIFLHLAKAFGLLACCRLLNRKKWRILCYHGFSYEDEHLFRPGLFMRQSVFKKRIQWLKKKGFHFYTISKAFELWKTNTLPPHSLTLTFDDGFYSTKELAQAYLKQENIPSTLYLTSYYAKKGSPIFRLMVQYLFWKNKKYPVHLNSPQDHSFLVIKGPGPYEEKIIWDIIHYGEQKLDNDGRQHLLTNLNDHLHIKPPFACGHKFLTLMGIKDLQTLSQRGMEIQLHTHRHKLPAEEKLLHKELQENKDFLKFLNTDLVHLSYPSGIYEKNHFKLLEKEGIKSATTLDKGLNDRKTSPFGLKRLPDHDTLRQIEFEALVSGFVLF